MDSEAVENRPSVVELVGDIAWVGHMVEVVMEAAVSIVAAELVVGGYLPTIYPQNIGVAVVMNS